MNIEDLFRNICETVSPVVDPDEIRRISQKSTGSTQAKPKPKKKLKEKPEPSYLKQTATNKAKQRDKSPIASPLNRAKSPMNSKLRNTGKSDAVSKTATMGSSKYEPPTELSEMIEDVATDELKLFFVGFSEIYSEFSVLQEITTSILENMGICLKVI